ncbi:hypothetical protein LCGC14_2598210, partial [marine sediment metagenome]
AIYISNLASEILQYGGISSEKGLKLTKILDKELQEKKGKLNPGTTADLISGVIFCALIFGLKF